MKGKVGKSATVISDLPESVLHQILSHLDFEDSIRTSVLSKQWNSARKSNPCLEFELPIVMAEMLVSSPEFKERLREFLNFVDRSLQHFVQNKLCIESMELDSIYVDRESVPLVNTWLPLALHRGVSDLGFHVRVGRNSGYPLPESTFVVDSSLLSGSLKFFRLQTLGLEMVCLTENIVCDIIRNCPNLRGLSLRDIRGLENLKISKADKLENLMIIEARCCRDIKSIYIDAVSLEHFFFTFMEGNRPCTYDLTSCRNLREIRLNCSGITDADFHRHISKFPLLELLYISSCHGLQRIRISLQRLNDLQIRCCKGVKAIEIDAPALSRFVFTPSGQNLPILVSSKVIPCSMSIYYDTVEPFYQICSWSLKLREYPGVSFENVNFYPSTDDIMLIFGRDMSREDFDRQFVEVDCLDLTRLRIIGSLRWGTLLDKLFSGCHPNIISMTVDSCDDDNCVNIFRKMLVQSECQSCSNLPHCKCWRRLLISAKIESVSGINLNIESIGEIDHKQFLRVLDTFVSIPMYSKVCFRLDWDHSEVEKSYRRLKFLTSFSISSE